MRARHRLPLLVTAAMAVAVGPVVATGALARPKAHHHRHASARRHYAPGYGSTYDPTPTCHYADGTPFDPDIIGGPNHVGDGGPAVNLGGFDPCGY